MTKDALKYLQPNAIIPIDMETTIALVNALKERLAQPAQRTWVGLTDEEKGFCAAPTYVETVARIEAKLKEKNQ
jgi:hypothetical protein